MTCSALYIISFKLNSSYFHHLAFNTLGKIFSGQHIEIFFLLFPENVIWHVMHFVSVWDNLHKNVKSRFLGKIKKKYH